jgi:hypothetical protein
MAAAISEIIFFFFVYFARTITSKSDERDSLCQHDLQVMLDGIRCVECVCNAIIFAAMLDLATLWDQIM